MGREPGDPRGAGLPPAGQERCHSLFAAPLGLGGPSGSLRSRQGLCLSASLSHPAQQSCSSVLGPPACHLPRGPGPGGASGGGTAQLAPGGSARPHIAMAKPGHCF